MLSKACGAGTEREKPGMSKVVTVKDGDSRAVILRNDWQSPSPEGMSMMCGAEPDPLCSTCQVIPSAVWTRNSFGGILRRWAFRERCFESAVE